MADYREVGHIFEGIDRHCVSSAGGEKCPRRDGEVLTIGQGVHMLDDGTEVEFCMWTECELHMTFWDVSVGKEKFRDKKEALEYLRNMGLYLEDVMEKGSLWHYAGISEYEDVYRVQYYEDD